MEDLTGIGKILDSEVAKRAYEDAASEPARQVGHLVVDALRRFDCSLPQFSYWPPHKIDSNAGLAISAILSQKIARLKQHRRLRAQH